MVFVLGTVHLLDTALHDVSDLVAVSRVVDLERRVGGRQNRGVAIVVLQTLTGQGGTTCGCTDDEAAAQLVGSSPEAVASALEAEHRVEDVNRDHRLAVGVVGGTQCDERSGCACLVNTHVNDLALGGLGVGEHELVVNGHVVLAVGVVQLSRGEEGVHTEGTCLIGGDGGDTVTEALHAHEVLHQADERHGGSSGLLAGALLGLCVDLGLGQDNLRLGVCTTGDVTAEFLTACLHVLQSRVVCLGQVVRRVVQILLQLLVGDGDVQVVTEALQCFHGELLDLVGGVTCLEERAELRTLNGLCQDDGGLALGLHSFLVGCVDLLVVVATQTQVEDLLVGQVCNQFLGLGVLAEEVLADVAAVFTAEGLVVTVEGFVHQLDELAALVLLEQLVVVGAPQDLDDVPACAAEECLELLNDLAVTANGAVQTLQVAVDDEGQVVQVLVCSQLQCTTRLGLVHLAVAQECPDVLLGGVLDLVVVQVLVEGCLVDCVQGTQTHGNGRELPELGHATGVRVRRNTVCALGLLLTEAVHLVFAQDALNECAGVDTGGGVTLEEDLVTATGVVTAAEEVVLAHFVEVSHTCEGGDVTANADALLLGTLNHNCCVPTNPCAVLALEFLITGVLGLLVDGDGVDVVGLDQSRDLNALLASLLEQCAKDVLCTLGAVSLDKVLEGLSPFLGLFYVDVLQAIKKGAQGVLVRYVSQTNPTSLLCGCEIARPRCCVVEQSLCLSAIDPWGLLRYLSLLS